MLEMLSDAETDWLLTGAVGVPEAAGADRA
jgi:hypothetical protein